MSHLKPEQEIEKQSICADCLYNKRRIKKTFKFTYLNIEDFVSNQDVSNLNTLTKKINGKNFQDFKIDEIPIGRFSIYELWLNNKLSELTIPKNLESQLKAKVLNALIVKTAVTKLLQKINISRLVLYNSFYGVNRIASLLAEKNKIPSYTIHAGGNYEGMYRKLTIFKSVEDHALINQHPAYSFFRSMPIPEQSFKEIEKHTLQFIESKSFWVYSKQSNQKESLEIKKELKIAGNQKVILAAMRSDDERLGAEIVGAPIFKGNGLFKTQYEWIDWLAQLASDHKELKIILRVHPREFPNKREGVFSQNGLKLINKFKNEKWPENLFINLPTDPFSLYDFIKVSDLVCNSTSTVGLEASLFGLPVLGTKEKVFAFDAELQQDPENLQDYERKIFNFLNEGWKLIRVVQACRWLNYLNTEVAINIDDSYDNRKTKQLVPKLKNPLRWLPKILRPTEPIYEILHRPKNGSANSNKLTFAILNNEKSHIGKFPYEFGNKKLEKEFVIRNLLIRANMIAHKTDFPFWDKISKVISEA
jgi:hypothetical protein